MTAPTAERRAERRAEWAAVYETRTEVRMTGPLAADVRVPGTAVVASVAVGPAPDTLAVMVRDLLAGDDVPAQVVVWVSVPSTHLRMGLRRARTELGAYLATIYGPPV